MKVGLLTVGIGAMTGPAALKLYAANAERLGFATLWMPEHVVLMDNYASRYPYSQDGRMGAPATSPSLDPFLTLASVAAVTSTIRLATGICLVPEHNPLVLGKSIATLDYLSGGRFALGVGIGWLKEEFDAIGVPWERRADRTREYIEAMRKLWGDDLSSYAGEFVRFENVRCFPKPARRSVPVIFGGESAPALRRAASYGNGWFGLGLLPDEAAPRIRRLEELLRENGRKLSDIEIATGPAGKSVTSDSLKQYRDAGVQELVLTRRGAPRSDKEMIADLEKIAREWIEPASRL